MAWMPLDVHRAAGARGDLDGQVGAVREGAEAVPVAPGQAHLVEQAGAIRGNNCVMRLRLYASALFPPLYALTSTTEGSATRRKPAFGIAGSESPAARF